MPARPTSASMAVRHEADSTSQVEPTNRGNPSLARVPAMLKVNPAPDGFTVYDVDADEAVVKFETRAEADELFSTLRSEGVPVELRHWSKDKVPPVY